MGTKTHLSIAVTTRNDNHGQDMAARTQAFADGLRLVADRGDFSAELIVVEWNPPPGAVPLAEAFHWPVGERIRTRIITVPPSVHARYKSAAAVPLFQMIAKNVATRRAEGEFILATNVDVLFPAELWEKLGPDRLQSGVLYRVDRVDVAPGPVFAAADPVGRLEACANSVVGIHARRCNFICNTPISLAAAQAQLGSTTRRFLAARVRGVARYLFTPKRKPGLWFHWNQLLEEISPYGWHNNACGDFTLMHRDDWARIGGYWEHDGFSMHLDTIGIYAARATGVRQEILATPIYHVEHKGGWSLNADRDGSFAAGLRARGLDVLPDSEAMVRLKRAHATGEPVYVNPPGWGLLNDDLPETLIAKGA